MFKQIGWLIGISLLTGVSFPERAIAHGATIEYQTTTAIQIHAKYDSNQPMSNAQVTIYTPDDPVNPWLTGNTDESGRFMFIPDPQKQGNWEVKVRQAGHGDMISIPWSETEPSSTQTQSGSSQNYTLMQKALTIVSVTWGFIGTALFFSRKSLNHQN